MDPILECPHCHALLRSDHIASGEEFSCDACQHQLEVHIFPALTRRDLVDSSGRAFAEEGDASCFYHLGRKAIRVCDGCGLFICELCDLDMGKQHVCPTCLEKGRTGPKISAIRSESFLYDGVALGLSLLPLTLVGWWVFPFSAPASIYFAIRYWNTPRSIVPRSNIRMVAAIVLSLLQIVGIVGLIVFFVFLARSGHSLTPTPKS
jgi:uncharacterized paraquat-inducible protein A